MQLSHNNNYSIYLRSVQKIPFIVYLVRNKTFGTVLFKYISMENKYLLEALFWTDRNEMFCNIKKRTISVESN